MTREEVRRAIDRCDREIAAMENQAPGAPAYLTSLGILDWQRERQFILDEANHQAHNPRD